MTRPFGTACAFSDGEPGTPIRTPRTKAPRRTVARECKRCASAGGTGRMMLAGNYRPSVPIMASMQPARWIPTQTAIALEDGATRTVHAYVCDAAPGLVVTQALAGRGETLADLARRPWAVTHRDSGRRIASAASLADAQALVLALAPVTDWTRDAEVLAESAVLPGAVRGAVLRAGVGV